MSRLRYRELNVVAEGRHRAFARQIEGEYRFVHTNGAGSAAERVAAYRALTQDLLKLIADEIAEGNEIRPYGSLWSASEVAIPRDRLINTNGMRNLRLEVPANMVAGAYAGDASLLRFLEGGESMAKLNQALFEQGLSLKTSGSNNGQTLAGALSTGTHGSAFDFGATTEFVVGLHLVVGPTRHVYLQRDSAPVVTQDFADMLGAELIESDAVFNAALVSFGSCGIIQGVLAETRPLFTLHATRFEHDYNDGLKKAITDLDFSDIDLSGAGLPDGTPTDKPHHFQVYFNPNLGNPPPTATVLMMFEDDWDPNYVPFEWESKAGPTAAALEVIDQVLANLPDVLDPIVKNVLNSRIQEQLKPYYRKGIIRDLVRGIRPKGHLLLSGTAVPRARAVEALDIVFDTYANSGELLPVIVATRFVPRTSSTLGFTRFAENCVFDIDTTSTPSSRQLVNDVRARLKQEGIPFAVHWGKLEREMKEFVTPAVLQEMYDNLVVQAFRQVRGNLLENDDVAKLFENDFMRDIGLV